MTTVVRAISVREYLLLCMFLDNSNTQEVSLFD